MRVLLIDDDKNIRFIIKMLMETGTDWEIDVAESGKEGLKIAQERQPDLILLDGPGTLDPLKEAGLGHVPVIILTARCQVEELEELSRLPVAGIITKPFDVMTLPDTIKTILSEGRQGQVRDGLLPQKAQPDQNLSKN